MLAHMASDQRGISDSEALRLLLKNLGYNLVVSPVSALIVDVLFRRQWVCCPSLF